MGVSRVGLSVEQTNQELEDDFHGYAFVNDSELTLTSDANQRISEAPDLVCRDYSMMNGGYLHNFVTNNKTEDVAKLALRMKYGVGSSKHKPVEYDKLQEKLNAKRLEVALTGEKLEKARCEAKAAKESSILREQRQVWSTECPKLQKAEEAAEKEVEEFLQQIRPSKIIDTAVFSLPEYAMLLEKEREEFRIATVDPIHQLQDDLRFRLIQAQRQQPPSHPSNWEQVQQQIFLIKDQQDEIMEKLADECAALQEEIVAFDVEDYLPTSDKKKEIVPKEILNSDCPFPELKSSVIQAFHSLWEQHQSRLQNLQEQLEKSHRLCGWCVDDHQRFLFTLSLYSHDITNHRALLMDMLQRIFPRRSRHELLEHERVLDSQRFSQAQVKVETQQYQRDHQELLAKALVTLQEAANAHQEELELHRDRQHQQDICLQLRNKLQLWRAQQEEAAKLEATIAARRREEHEAKMKKEQEREAAMRSHQKERVRQFHFKLQKNREEVERRDQERLAQLRSVMAEQARQDQERVQFRAEMLQKRKEEREAREAELQREEEERQNRLEALRNQVAVVAEADSERMMGDTEARRIRQMNEKEFVLQKPLFGLNTYTDKQFVSDPRVKVAQALREAGLQHSQYAKQVLSDIKPPKPPRRDTNSIIKF
ncbi:coiled-coil domain-containing protein 148-like isoform 1-T2 [Synchiropus picturatus]